MVQVEVTIDSVRRGMPTNVWAVILKEKGADRYLPIWVSQSQADILTGELQERPDKSIDPDRFLANIAAAADIKCVGIYLGNDAFYAKLLLSHHNEPYEVRCPISVALALATRTKTPIFS